MSNPTTSLGLQAPGQGSAEALLTAEETADHPSSTIASSRSPVRESPRASNALVTRRCSEPSSSEHFRQLLSEDERTPLLQGHASPQGSTSSSPRGKRSPRKSSIATMFDNYQVLWSLPPLLMIFGGTLVLRYFEGWSYLTSLYVITEMVTTTGYGDFTVTSGAAKIFMSFYAVGVLIVLAFYFNRYLQVLVTKQNDGLRSYLRRIEISLSGDSISDEQAKKLYATENKVIAYVLMFIFMIALGTCFFRFYEHCSCSYGFSRVPGCNDGHSFEVCQASGGHVKDWAGSFYLSVITLSTVGFGDYQPRTLLGRVFGIFWMLSGVCTTALFITNLSSYFFERNKHMAFSEADCIESIDKTVFNKMDRDGSGTLERGEFLAYMVVKFGLVSAELCDHLHRQFDAMDSEGNNHVKYEAILRRQMLLTASITQQDGSQKVGYARQLSVLDLGDD